MSDNRKTCKRYNIPGDAHELTFSTYRRLPLLSNNLVCIHLSGAITRAKATHQFHLWGWVFMPDHIHLLILPLNEHYSIGDILKSIKQPVGRIEIAKAKKSNPGLLAQMSTGLEKTPYRFWQEGGGYDKNLTHPTAIHNSLAYIHNNPVKTGLAASPDLYAWSSFREWHDIEAVGPSIDREYFPIL
jgi:putative transposase